jgi:hypothetical protein
MVISNTKSHVYSLFMKTGFLFLLATLTFTSALSQEKIFITFTPGVSLALPAPLHISQKGYDDISLWAKYDTYPLRLPFYYSYSAGIQRGNTLYEIEMNHLKIYLTNSPPQVKWFSVSHGYNQFFFNRGTWNGKTGQKFGAGLVIAHPESTIRGKELEQKGGLFNNGTYLSGVAFQYAVYKEINVSKNVFFLVEAKASIGYARIRIVEGKADVPVAALHLLIGPCFRVTTRQKAQNLLLT